MSVVCACDEHGSFEFADGEDPVCPICAGEVPSPDDPELRDQDQS